MSENKPPAQAETALEFARICMGWGDCDIGATTPCIVRSGESFSYNDLNAVMEAASGWADRRRIAWFRLDYSMPDRCFYAKVHGGMFGGDVQSEARYADPCRALITACVEAAKAIRQ